MAIVAGTFTASALAKSVLMADRMWADSMINADFVADVEVVKAILGEQNARVSELVDGDKDRTVRVHWLNMCAEVPVPCDGDDCDLAGNQLGSDFKDYAITECQKWSFTVNENALRSNDYNMEDLVAKGILKADKILSEEIARFIMERLETFKGENVVSDGTGSVVADETYIESADWNERLFAYFYRVSKQNKFSSPFLLSGSNLFEEKFMTMLNASNSNGSGAAAAFKFMRTYFDLFNVDAYNTPDAKTYMINRGAVAFASKNYYGAVPTVYKSQDRYSVASRNLPGVRYDVFYTNRCSGTTIMHDWTFVANFDLFLNPLGCTAERTGVLSFINGTTP